MENTEIYNSLLDTLKEENTIEILTEMFRLDQKEGFRILTDIGNIESGFVVGICATRPGDCSFKEGQITTPLELFISAKVDGEYQSQFMPLTYENIPHIMKEEETLRQFVTVVRNGKETYGSLLNHMYKKEEPVVSPVKDNSISNTIPKEVYLNVPFAQKDEAKALGARWDPTNKMWYCKEGDESKFTKWSNLTAFQKSTLQRLQGSSRVKEMDR